MVVPRHLLSSVARTWGLRGWLYRHAQSAQSLLPHRHGHALLLSPGLPAGGVNLLVYIRVLPQCLQQVLCQGPNALVTGYLLQFMQVCDGVSSNQNLPRRDQRDAGLQLCRQAFFPEN